MNATIATSTDLMKRVRKTYEPVIYEGRWTRLHAGRRGAGYQRAQPKARTDAWKRWLSLLRKP